MFHKHKHHIIPGLVSLITFLILFYLGINPITVSNFIDTQVSKALENVISTASVPKNPYNTLAYQLEQKEKRLAEKEKSLNEIRDTLGRDNEFFKKILIYLSPFVVALFILILINFYFDYKERKILKKIEKEEKEIVEMEKKITEQIFKKN